MRDKDGKRDKESITHIVGCEMWDAEHDLIFMREWVLTVPATLGHIGGAPGQLCAQSLGHNRAEQNKHYSFTPSLVSLQ